MVTRQHTSDQDNITRPRYIAKHRNRKDMNPLKVRTTSERKVKNGDSDSKVFVFQMDNIYIYTYIHANQIIPQPTPLQGHGHTSANFSASLV